MIRLGVAAALVGLTFAGCFTDRRLAQERSAGTFSDNAPEVLAPKDDRCVAHGKSGVRQSCDDARYLGQLYVRRLSTGDQVCLQNGFGETPGAACQARAAVADVDQGRVLLEIREAQPGSRWFKNQMGQVWFQEGALVDLYLAERGY